MREIALDTETTGLSFDDGDRIVEIGCVEIIDKVITKNVFHRYINPNRLLSIASKEITGLSDDFLKQFDPFEKVVNDFLNFIGNDRLVIHNAKFDVGFINGELDLLGQFHLSQQVIDTLSMAKHKYPGSPATLDALCRRFSVSTDSREKHGALIDAKLLAEIYIIMSVQKTQKNIFAPVIDDNSDVDHSKTNITYRKFKNSKEEICLHSEFLSQIKEPLWLQFEKK